ncbi:beta-glucan synthesis-associated [Irpex rosettiformis]|uniref:Beta-glucan synthesis-associated n=1 Tax=Irpex rosettiformis TaxID=378272 RepID=A0ACB8U8K7_9APHY|nr:beta-glucan synthesis-associated [Irpex rosettiformis]
MSAPWPTSHDGGETIPSGSSSPDDTFHTRTPTTSNFDQPLLAPDSPSSKPPTRSFSASNFVSSPLNPNATHGITIRSRPASRGSAHFNRIASEESQALTADINATQRGSMVLYRLAGDYDNDYLLPPKALLQRDSVVSSSGDSIFSLSSDSKYPSGAMRPRSGFVPYAYDPDLDSKDEVDDDDPAEKGGFGEDGGGCSCSTRGFLNLGVLVLLIGGLLCLFVLYPVITFIRNNGGVFVLDGNTRTNSTGTSGGVDNVPKILASMPEVIDPETPDSAKSRTGFDGQEYELVFSDEFNTDGRTFYPGDDPFWEAADIWYGSTADQEWYDPKQITTQNGYLRILMEQVADQTTNHELPYRSGMLQSWNKFCFSSGYIEVSLTLPGGPEAFGYWAGAWTMGNLARPGYGATTDGVWPYTYNECDIGILPNQTYLNGTGPEAALHSDASRSKYNFELSWLPGQRLSACTCSGEDHPGPDVSVGRGAPEIDILEVEHNKTGGTGQVVSQSAQFAPFTHDYLYVNDTTDAFNIFTPDITKPNGYRGSAVQQALSSLTNLPDEMFQTTSQTYRTLGFEYWANPDKPEDGFITWQSNGQPSYRIGASAVGPDQGQGGSMVGQRRIPEEPMSIVLNLGISPNWQKIDTSTMTFPAEMRVDYVRVYQRKGQTNIGCSPTRFPTADYIDRHMDAYTNPNISYWTKVPSGLSAAAAGYSWPKQSLSGC